MNAPFGSVLTAVVTPFSEGADSVDFRCVDKLINHLCPRHTDGIVVCGTAPQGTAIVANTGTNNTAQSVAATRDAMVLDVDGVMAVMPYYNKPNFDGQIAHFTAIADVGLPVLLYNVPGRTGAKILPEAVAELSSHKNIVAIKEAGGDPEMVDWYKKNCRDGFAVYSGDDPLTMEMVKRGAVGVVSVASLLVGDEIKRMIELTKGGKTENALEIHEKLMPLFDALFTTTNPIPVKTACAMLGLCNEEFRLPMTVMQADLKRKLREMLTAKGVLQESRQAF